MSKEECPYNCGILIQRQSIKEHKKFCENLPIECDKCGEFYKRHYHSLHVKTCPFIVIKCPFMIVGCKHKVQNKDLQRHFNESVSKHSTLVATQSQEVLAQIQETKSIIEQQRREKLDCYGTEADKITHELVAAHSRISILQKKLEEAKQLHKNSSKGMSKQNLNFSFGKIQAYSYSLKQTWSILSKNPE